MFLIMRKKTWTSEKIAHLIEVYKKHSKKDTMKILSLRDGQLRGVLNKNKIVIRQPKRWTQQEEVLLRKHYSLKILNLDELAITLGKHKTNICRKAKSLGLTDQKRQKKSDPNYKRIRMSGEVLSSHLSKRMKEWHKKNPHPKGMLGKNHSTFTKESLKKTTKLWHQSISKKRKKEIQIKSMETRIRNNIKYNPHGKWKQDWRNIGGRLIFFRSRWEANYARILEVLKTNNQINDWRYEPKTFLFHKEKECISYLPDFIVTMNDGSQIIHEVKGWMDRRSKLKLIRMKRYYPEEKILVINAKKYSSLKKKYIKLIPEWELDSKGR